MKTKKLRGFTLIECIVAMALIGITSLLMVQVYGTVAKMNRDNNRINNSLEKQMEFVENELVKENGDEAVQIYRLASYTPTGDDDMSHTVDGSTSNITFKVKKENNVNSKATYLKGSVSADIDLYVVGVKVSNDSEGTVYDSDNTVRYKFILPRKGDDKKVETK